jgi:predicted metal-dependent peptidase
MSKIIRPTEPLVQPLSGKEVVERAKSILQRQKFFYYSVIRQFRTVENPKIDTAGVCWIKNRMYFLYNPTFASYYTPYEFATIVQHEVDHFVYDHVQNYTTSGIEDVFKTEEDAKDGVRKQMIEQYDHQLKNIAMDRDINAYNRALPNIRMLRSVIMGGSSNQPQNGDNGGQVKANESILGVHAYGPTEDEDIVEVSAITVESFKKLLSESGYSGDVNQVQEYEAWKYYYDLLRNTPKVKDQMHKYSTIDVHFKGSPEDLLGEGSSGEQGEGEGQETEGTGQPSKNEANRIIIDAYKASKGSDVPGHLRGAIEQAINEATKKPLPWDAILRKHINKAKKSITKADINVVNHYYTSKRRVINGYLTDPLFKVGVVFDTSGSCMDEDTQTKFWAQIEGLRKAKAQITIYYTDAAVEHIQHVNPHKPLKAEDYQGKGGGGTMLDFGIVKAIEDKNNIIIKLTDCWMDYRLTKEDLKGQKVICVSTTEDKQPDHYGPTIHVTKEE